MSTNNAANTWSKLIDNKLFCIIWSVVALGYSFILPFCWGNDPMTETGTLSLLCETPARMPFFWIWAILTAGAFLLNVEHMFRKYGYSGKSLQITLLLAVVSVLLIALTLGHDITTWNPKRIAHWAATVGYIVFLAATILLLFLLQLKSNRSFWKALALGAAILLLVALWFFILGKSGLMEIVPMALMLVLLLVVNFTGFVPTTESHRG
jgi:hypothetical protein